MWLSTEDARGDYVLAIAAIVLGNRFVAGILAPLPPYPVTGTAGIILSIAWIPVLGAATPILLARWRRQVPGAFGIEGPGGRDVAVGVVTAAPLLVAHLVPFALEGDFGALARALGGRMSLSAGLGVQLAATDRVYLVLAVVFAALSCWLFASFVTVRSRDAFRSPDMDLTEAVRTFGMGAVGGSFVFGLLNMARGYSFGNTMRVSLALLAVVLLTDQYVPTGRTTTRATILAPAIAVTVLYVLAAGGLFAGDLLNGLYFASGAAVVTVCAAGLIEARRGVAAAILLVTSGIYAFPILAQPIPDVLLSV